MDTPRHPLRSRHWLGAFAALAVLCSTTTPAREALAARDKASVVRARVVDLVNEARSRPRRCGSERFAATSPLRASPALNDAARAHARNMARRKFFEHRAPDGTEPRDRVLRAGYKSRLTGENIALGPESAEEVVAGWLASPGHCANIMDPRFKDIGVGVAIGRGRGQIYWVQNFGLPRG